MATYAIGDIQGCHASFQDLLERVSFNPSNDTLWLVGDLINRGPASLEMLRWVYQHQSCVVTVLGNHDLHTLAVAEGFLPQGKSDTLQALLAAPDCNELLFWLRQQSLIHAGQGYFMVHAGLLPQWSTELALALGAEVETALQGANYRDFLAHMYGNYPDRWDANLRGMDRLRLITNAMTRLRICTDDGVMDFKFKGEFKDIPLGYRPWFEVPARQSVDTPIIFGHWSALGLLQRANVIGLDTGCQWGRELTAIRLEDKQIFQVTCNLKDAVKPS